MSSPLLHGAADITISNGGDSDITAPPGPFKDASDNGGPASNLKVVTLVGTLGPAPVLVTTATSGGSAPLGGRITVVDSITWNSTNALTLTANSSILVGATVTNNAGGGLTLSAVTDVAFNADVILSGGTSQLAVTSAGISQQATRKLLIDGLADLNAGAAAITLPEANNFGSLRLTGGAITINEVSASTLAGVTAGSLNLTSAGAITDTGNVNVSGAATLTGTAINLGSAGEATSLGSLRFTSAGPVTLQLDSGTSITGANTASTFTLGVTGTAAFAAGATLTATALDLQNGTVTLAGNNLADPMNVTNTGTLTVNGAETINTYTQNGAGALAGTAALTATNGATLNGGSVTGNLLANTTVAGAVAISGSVGGGFLNVNSGTLTFSGTSASGPVTIATAAGLVDTGNLSDTAAVTNAGLFTVNANDTIGTYLQSTTGTLAGNAALTATNGATLNGGSITGNLLGNTTVAGTVGISGSVGGGFLHVDSGALTFSGSSTSTPVTIAALAGLTDTGNLSNVAAVTNAGLFTVNANDTIGTYLQSATGTLAGTAALTATTATLNGGSVTGNLLANTTVAGNVAISGSVGGGFLNVSSGTLIFSGTSTSTPVDIAALATLTNTGNLSNTAAVTNAGLFTVNANDTVGTYTQHATGTLAGTAALTATVATLHSGSVTGNLLANTTVAGNVAISGSVGGGFLNVDSGTLTFSGTSTSTPVTIAAPGTLLNTGNLSDTAAVTNAGLFTVSADDTIATYTQNGIGTLAGVATLPATGGATLNGGMVSGHLLGDTTSTGTVLIALGGSVGGGFLRANSGILTLNGTANSNTSVFAGATLKGTGLVNGNLLNNGTLAVGSAGGTLTVSGNLATTGTVALAVTNRTVFEQIRVGGNAGLGGNLIVTNTGAGLAVGQVAHIINAGSYTGAFGTFSSVNFSNGLLFNDFTGQLIGLGGGSSLGGGYLNLSGNQTNVYLSLFEDSVQPGVQNVFRVPNPAGSGEIVNFTSGAANGNPQLVKALYQATFTTPGIIDGNTMNQLSPEVYRGLADYTQQALRSHVRAAEEAAPISRKGKTQVFATLHSDSAGVDGSATNAGYDTELFGITAGMRYDLNANFQLGALLGFDDGSIEGALIDTDAQGFVLGAFAHYRLNDAHKTVITGSLSYGDYDYDATRHSFGGDANADSIGSDALELALGVSTVLYDKDGLRVSPTAAFRYMTGGVDGFVENGPGIPLAVGSQDIDELVFDIGLNFNYQVQQRLALVGRLGYIQPLSDSDENLSAAFAATGPAGMPFSVSSPGIDQQAFTFGFGVFYDLNDNTRIGATYRGEIPIDSNYAQSFGLGVSYGF